MTTIGITTAIAIFAGLPRPPPPLDPEPEALRAEGVADVPEPDTPEETVAVLVVDVCPPCVDVTTITEAVSGAVALVG